MQIKIPPTGGIVPEAVDDWQNASGTYIARIKVVGVYTERGFGHDETLTIEHEVWRSEVGFNDEEIAVTVAADKLAEMLRKLI